MILLALAMTTGAFAQKMWVGGSLSLSATSNTHNLDLRPSFGYFVAEQISVEGNINFDFNTTTNNYALVAVGRYWMPITDAVSYTPGVALDFNVVDYDNDYSSLKTDFAFGIGLQLGAFNYAVNDNWAVTANFCTLNLNRLFDDAYVNFGLSTSTTLTVRYFF